MAEIEMVEAEIADLEPLMTSEVVSVFYTPRTNE